MAAGLRLVPASGAPIEIGQDQVLVGREPICDVVLTDGSVSRKHARLERRGRIWTVVDQGSANGTFVDSQRVTETTLRSGQELRFGSVTFRVEIEGEEAAGATILTDAPEATVVHGAPPPPPRPAVPPPPAPPPPPVRPPPAAVPPTGSLPPGSIPPRVTAPSRPPAPGAARPTSRPPAPPSDSMAPAPPPPPKKGKSPLFWVATGCCGCLILVVAVVALIGGAAFHMTAEPVAAVRGQLADLKSGNIDAAYARFSEDYKARISREEFEVLVSRHAALRENTDSTFWKRSIENDQGTLSGVLTAASGAHETVNYRLIKEGGAWKIADIEFGGSP